MTGYGEPECLLCGYVNYGYVPPTTVKPSGLISTATMFVLTYVGEFPALAEIRAHVQALKSDHIDYAVTCPFCNEPMQVAAIAGKRKDRRETRYKCQEGHRISLTPAENSLGLGWN